MGQEVLLQMKNISKEFPGVKALDNVSLTLKKGTVHALMGENGAGKSTLMKCLFGMYSKDSGTIELEGKEVSFKNSKEALESGVAMVHQELNQALKRNVMDNIWLGRYPKIGGLMVNEKKIYQDTLDVFKELEIDVDPKRIMSTMPVSQRQMVEIAKAVSFQSKVIVFDEPTSSLTEEEVEHLFRIINMLRDRGVGIIYISHKMAEIKRISDEITIMRDGTWVTTKPADELSMDDIIRLMVGRELTNQFPPKTNKPGEVALEVEHLTAQYSLLKDVSFTARKGEILGIAGLDGSGKMGKSNGNGVYLYDDEKTITKKVMKAVTDSGPAEPDSPMPEMIANLFTLLKLVSDQSTVDYFTEKWNDCSIRYGDLKKQLAADICKMTLPIRERIDAIYNDDSYLSKVVASGRERARESAAATLSLVRKAVGFISNLFD